MCENINLACHTHSANPSLVWFTEIKRKKNLSEPSHKRGQTRNLTVQKEVLEVIAKMEYVVTNLGISQAEGGSSFGAWFLSACGPNLQYLLSDELR